MRKLYWTLAILIALAGLIYIELKPPQTLAAPVELIEKRNQNSKTWQAGPNSYIWEGSLGPLHFQDQFNNNVWTDIDNTLLPTVSPWNWVMNQDSYQVLIKNDLTAGQVLEYSRKWQSVAFQPMALQWTNDLGQIQQLSMPQAGTLSVIGNEIKWDGGYGPNTRFSWFNQPGRLKKELALLVAPSLPTQTIINGGNPVLELNFIFDPSSTLDIWVNGVLWDKQANNPVSSVEEIEFRVVQVVAKRWINEDVIQGLIWNLRQASS